MKFLKALIFTVVFFFISTSAWALDFTWDHDNPEKVEGYIMYYAPTDGSSGPYNIMISGGMTMTVSIPDTHFEPNTEYTFYVTAYNITGESEGSDSIVYTRHGWGPPSDVPPIKLWIKPGKPKNTRKS